MRVWSLGMVAVGMLLLAGMYAPREAIAQLPSDNPKRTPFDRTLDLHVAEFFAKGQHVGLSIGICEHGRTRFYDYGMISKSAGRLPDNRSIYEIASITKTFTGALASMAILEHRMELDGDFREYLGGS